MYYPPIPRTKHEVDRMTHLRREVRRASVLNIHYIEVIIFLFAVLVNVACDE